MGFLFILGQTAARGARRFGKSRGKIRPEARRLRRLRRNDERRNETEGGDIGFDPGGNESARP